jgi:hypothetical protein
MPILNSISFDQLPPAAFSRHPVVTGPGAGHPNVPRHFFLRFGLSSEAGIRKSNRYQSV